jgi:hypothetical protein
MNRIRLYLIRLIYNNSRLKTVLKFIIPKWIRVSFKRLVSKSLNLNDALFVKNSRSNNTTLYLIRGHNAGLYSIIHSVMGHLIFAELNGLIPIVDYQTLSSFYQEETVILNTRNVWEYFFLQPSNYLLEDVSNYNVMYSDLGFSSEYSGTFEHIYKLDKPRILIYNRIFNDYIKYNSFTSDYINKVLNQLKRFDMSKTLAVYVRGSDYKSAVGHHIQPDLNEIIEEINRFISAFEIETIFLSTEETITLDYFIELYGDRVKYQNRERITHYDNNTPTHSVRFNRSEDKFWTALEYLTDIEISSRCSYFISGISSGSVAIIERNGLKFNEFKTFFKGLMK